ncbi:hypothetical protein Hypma_003592 [Hypsizygus marmoreus]|uniref:Uncharacterized protein n=1 Tax=Hypsizygus marmoreus TaxID=39966 RepID=A0A369J1T0_HYPMA|nr:hypothetical protein Hypma_003592 [Hypsizygus marmoreus]
MTFLLFPSIILAIAPMFYVVFQLTATTAEPQMPSPSPLDDIDGHFLGPSRALTSGGGRHWLVPFESFVTVEGKVRLILLVNTFESHEESCTAEEYLESFRVEAGRSDTIDDWAEKVVEGCIWFAC